MKIEFDPEKERVNRRVHGLSLAFGLDVLRASVADRSDDRHDYGEDRRLAYGRVGGRLYVCVYTLRRGVHLIISVRKANRREQARHDRPRPED